MTAQLDLNTAYASMALIRTFEQTLLDLFARGELMGTTHTCLGQEANAVGICSALEETDVVISAHRGHGHFLAHIGDADGLMAEIMGKENGVCAGWGGSQHLCVPDRFYSNGIQGGIVPLATGLAFGAKLKRQKSVACVFVGDGTFGQGVVYESLNVAAKHKAPLVLVVENNDIAQTTPRENVMSGSFADRAKAFGVSYTELDCPTVDEVYAAARPAVQAARKGSGPQMIVINSVRLGPHSKGDDTRSEEQLEALRARDPFMRTEALLEDTCIALEDAERIVSAAVEKAKSTDFAPLPKGTAGMGSEAQNVLDKVAGKTFLENVNDGLKDLMEHNADVVLYGEDVMDPYGGAFKTTKGLSSAFPDRVWPMPISEAAMAGIAGGLSLKGLVPVVEIMFGDFLTLTFDQLVNHLSKYRSMFHDQVRVPAIIRTPMGGRRGYGPTHSQTLDKHFAGVVGLNVFAPSPYHDMGSIYRQCAELDGPTLMIENKAGYGYRVPQIEDGLVGDFAVEYGGTEAAPWVSLSMTEFEDEDVTLLSYGGMLPIVLEAAHTLMMDEEIAVRVVAPSRLHPLNGDELCELLAEDGPVLVVEEGSDPFGFGSEVAALLAERGELQERGFARLGAKEMAIACSRPLEDQVLVQPLDVQNAVLELL